MKLPSALARAAARTSLASIIRAWNTSESSFMKAILGSRHSRLCLFTPESTHARRPSQGITHEEQRGETLRCTGSAASRCVNEPNGLKSTQDESKVWSASIVLCVIPLNRQSRQSMSPTDAHPSCNT
jgi:hypothetical protein